MRSMHAFGCRIWAPVAPSQSSKLRKTFCCAHHASFVLCYFSAYECTVSEKGHAKSGNLELIPPHTPMSQSPPAAAPSPALNATQSASHHNQMRFGFHKFPCALCHRSDPDHLFDRSFVGSIVLYGLTMLANVLGVFLAGDWWLFKDDCECEKVVQTMTMLAWLVPLASRGVV